MSLHIRESNNTVNLTEINYVKIYYSQSYSQIKIPVNDFQRALCVAQPMGSDGTDTGFVMFVLVRDYSNTKTKVRIVSNPLNLTLDTRLDVGYGDQQYFVIGLSNGEVALSYWELLVINMSIDNSISSGTDGSEF